MGREAKHVQGVVGVLLGCMLLSCTRILAIPAAKPANVILKWKGQGSAVNQGSGNTRRSRSGAAAAVSVAFAFKGIEYNLELGEWQRQVLAPVVLSIGLLSGTKYAGVSRC